MFSAKTSGIEPLPPLYQAWIDDILSGPIPAESAATCADCRMCSDAAPAGDATRFNPRTKCCTFFPELANFLVGRVLLDDDPGAARGRESIRARIRARSDAVSPLGLGQTRAYSVLFRGLWSVYQQRGLEVFGRGDAVRCPHYDDELAGCGIWRHRESSCAVWFCTYERGAAGERFWGSLRALLQTVEVALARWCLRGLDPEGQAWSSLPAPPRDHAPPGDVDAEARYLAAWGPWAAREEELYSACARQVESLAWRDVLAIGGGDLATKAAHAREAHRLLVSAAPG